MPSMLVDGPLWCDLYSRWSSRYEEPPKESLLKLGFLDRRGDAMMSKPVTGGQRASGSSQVPVVQVSIQRLTRRANIRTIQREDSTLFDAILHVVCAPRSSFHRAVN